MQQQPHQQQVAQPREYISQPRHMMRTSMPIQSPLVVSTPQGFRKRPQQMMTEAQVRHFIIFMMVKTNSKNIEYLLCK